MRSSSARQQEFDFSGLLTATSAVANSSTPFGGGPSATFQDAEISAPKGTAGELSLPNFGGAKDLYAIAARRAARLNAATITDVERDRWLTERQMLLDKEFDGAITRAEKVRLEYVRWQLDRIDDARHGESMDLLESIVLQYEQFQTDLQNLQGELAKHKKGTRR